MKISLINVHLFYKYFVRQSVGQATEGKRASLLMDVVILIFITTVIVPLEYILFVLLSKINRKNNIKSFDRFLKLLSSEIQKKNDFLFFKIPFVNKDVEDFLCFFCSSYC